MTRVHTEQWRSHRLKGVRGDGTHGPRRCRGGISILKKRIFGEVTLSNGDGNVDKEVGGIIYMYYDVCARESASTKGCTVHASRTGFL